MIPAPPARPRLDTHVGFLAIAMGLTCGYDATAMAGALLLVTHRFALTTTQQGLLYATSAAGTIVGALLSGRLVNALGRRTTLLWMTFLYLAATVPAVTSRNPAWLDSSRFAQGTAIGIAIVATPILIAESASTRARGRIAVLYQVATAFGCALGYFGGYFLAGSGQWRLMLAVPGALALTGALTLVRLPETSRWRQLRQQRQQFQQQPQPQPQAQQQAGPGAGAGVRLQGVLRAMLSPRYRTLTLFVAALGFFVQATGINAMVYFSPRIFQQMGYTDSFGLLMLPGFVQLAGAVAALFCALTIDRFGRRPALLTGTALMGLGHAAMVLLFATGAPETVGFIGFIGLIVFTIGFNSGFGALVWIFAAEGFPDHLRGAGASVMLLTNLTTNFFVARFFLDLLNAAGGATTYSILLGVTVLAWLFVRFLAPETKGRSLDEVQSYWENGRRWPARSTAATGPVVTARRAPRSVR
ncbi:MFS transporter [Streptacidiphilus sp. PAMC 29251]